MVEEAHARKCHSYIPLVASLDNKVVTDRAARLCDVAYAALVGTFNIVSEREERIGTERNAADCVKVGSDFLGGERLRTLGEILLPVALGADVLLVLVDVAVDDVVTLRSAECVKERKIEHLVALTEEPCVRLAACETGAVDS